MKPETLAALRSSIKKWQNIVAGTGEDLGWKNCQLCHRFGHCELNGELCPVRKKSGRVGCLGTPYVIYKEIEHNTDVDRSVAAQDELEFLTSLLPDGESL